jgi:hypothetical protein
MSLKADPIDVIEDDYGRTVDARSAEIGKIIPCLADNESGAGAGRHAHQGGGAA